MFLLIVVVFDFSLVLATLDVPVVECCDFQVLLFFLFSLLLSNTL